MTRYEESGHEKRVAFWIPTDAVRMFMIYAYEWVYLPPHISEFLDISVLANDIIRHYTHHHSVPLSDYRNRRKCSPIQFDFANKDYMYESRW